MFAVSKYCTPRSRTPSTSSTASPRSRMPSGVRAPEMRMPPKPIRRTRRLPTATVSTVVSSRAGSVESAIPVTIARHAAEWCTELVRAERKVSMTSVSVPDWFTRALADVPEQRSIEVLGARVSYRTWGTPGAPGVVLVHGGSAHAGWWDHVAPQLTGYRVVAPDLSGHGDSDHREDYDVRVWAREVVEVAAAED